MRVAERRSQHLPINAKFAAANNAALAQATQSWQQMGITKPQLSPIINAYNNAKGSLRTCKLPKRLIISQLPAICMPPNNRQTPS